MNYLSPIQRLLIFPIYFCVRKADTFLCFSKRCIGDDFECCSFFQANFIFKAFRIITPLLAIFTLLSSMNASALSGPDFNTSGTFTLSWKPQHDGVRVNCSDYQMKLNGRHDRSIGVPWGPVPRGQTFSTEYKNQLSGTYHFELHHQGCTGGPPDYPLVTFPSERHTVVVDLPKPPTISAIDDKRVAANTSTSPIAFTIDDPNSRDRLSVRASSSNRDLVPPSGIALSGSGANRHVVVTPAAGRSGRTTIILTVSDGRLSATESFVVIVDAPPASDIKLEVGFDSSGDVNQFFRAMHLTLRCDCTAIQHIEYKLSSGNWQRYSGTMVFDRTTTVSARVAEPSANSYGPVVSQTYSRQLAPQ